MNKFILVAIASAFVVPLCCGQELSPPDVPAGNPTRFPSGAAQWSIEVTYKPVPSTPGMPPPPANAVSGRTKHLEVVQSDTLQCTTATHEDGKKIESWFVPATQIFITTDTQSGKPVCLTQINRKTITFLATGFELNNFRWIDRANFVNTMMVGGQRCWHYKAVVTMTTQQIEDQGGHPGTYEAWIDATTFQPAALSDGLRTGVYTYAKTPPPPLTMTKAIADAYDFITRPLVPTTR